MGCRDQVPTKGVEEGPSLLHLWSKAAIRDSSCYAQECCRGKHSGSITISLEGMCTKTIRGGGGGREFSGGLNVAGRVD